MTQTIYKSFSNFSIFRNFACGDQVAGGGWCMNFFVDFFPGIQKVFGNKCVAHLFLRNLRWVEKLFWTYPPWLGDPLLYNQTTRRTQLRPDLDLCPTLKHVGPLPHVGPCLNGSSATTTSSGEEFLFKHVRSIASYTVNDGCSSVSVFVVCL